MPHEQIVAYMAGVVCSVVYLCIQTMSHCFKMMCVCKEMVSHTDRTVTVEILKTVCVE